MAETVLRVPVRKASGFSTGIRMIRPSTWSAAISPIRCLMAAGPFVLVAVRCAEGDEALAVARLGADEDGDRNPPLGPQRVVDETDPVVAPARADEIELGGSDVPSLAHRETVPAAAPALA